MTSLSDIQVLVVDDNQQMRTLLRHLLRAGGLQHLIETENGQQALSMLRRANADLIIADWKMGPMDGLEFTQAIRAGMTGANPCVPVLMLTAHTETSRVIAARDAGVSGFVKKPISARLLFDRITSALTDTRVFVRSTDYIGPDRRRGQAKNYIGPFRRDSDQLADTLDLDDFRLHA
jgi:CheY-like chemotaxis protein